MIFNATVGERGLTPAQLYEQRNPLELKAPGSDSFNPFSQIPAVVSLAPTDSTPRASPELVKALSLISIMSKIPKFLISVCTAAFSFKPFESIKTGVNRILNLFRSKDSSKSL